MRTKHRLVFAALMAALFSWLVVLPASGAQAHAALVPMLPPPANTYIYRLYDPERHDHFYTEKWYEVIDARFNHGYTYEGILCAYSSSGDLPLHRLLDPSGNHHFYTTDYQEYLRVFVQLNYSDEGTVGTVWSSQAKAGASAIPLYRMNNPSVKDHLYTTSSVEVAAAGGSGYSLEGIIGYVLPAS